ncbi:MAG: helix-turn-helix transcriptional regulator [Clostridia bacterium]|nr:helix-turn-helix transcriptional regulator [Clostridia bacterium]
MHYYSEIIPLFEAFVYLSERFSESRTSDRIRSFEPRKEEISAERWTYFQRIVELQNELDDLIAPSELIEHYFTPLKTKTELPAYRTITLGGLLLQIPAQMQPPFDFDQLLSYYKTASQKDLLVLFYSSTLAPFFNDTNNFDDISVSTIVAAANDNIVSTEDKWALIDCITNPCEHLERLRPVVEKVMDHIENRSEAFSGFISKQMEGVCGKDKFIRNMSELMSTELKQKDIANASVYPSLFLFNAYKVDYEAANKKNTLEFYRFIIGVYYNTLLELRRQRGNPGVHIQLLKMLSDQTRFNILHDLCGKQSYGQELADKYGGARSAIYYHLDKLLSFNLIDLKMTEYRNLYTMNKQNVYDKMNAIRDYLLNGWKPEAKQEEAQTETPETGGESGPEE